jgi:hypothetical protein
MRGVDSATRIHQVEMKSQAEAEPAGAVIKGFANIFGLVEVVKQTGDAVKRAIPSTARCPKDGNSGCCKRQVLHGVQHKNGLRRLIELELQTIQPDEKAPSPQVAKPPKRSLGGCFFTSLNVFPPIRVEYGLIWKCMPGMEVHLEVRNCLPVDD